MLLPHLLSSCTVFWRFYGPQQAFLISCGNCCKYVKSALGGTSILCVGHKKLTLFQTKFQDKFRCSQTPFYERYFNNFKIDGRKIDWKIILLLFLFICVMYFYHALLPLTSVPKKGIQFILYLICVTDLTDLLSDFSSTNTTYQPVRCQ